MSKVIFIVLLLFIACHQKNEEPRKDLSLINKTEVVINWDTTLNVLHYCSAILEDSILQFKIDSFKDSISNVVVSVVQSGDSFKIAVYQPWSMTDCTYINRRFQLLAQEVETNKKTYKVGDQIQGRLKLLLLGHGDYFSEQGEVKLRENWDTVRISGVFTAKVWQP
jgi:hypothetical protein